MVFLLPQGSHYPDMVDSVAYFCALCKPHLKEALFSFWAVFLNTVCASGCVLFLLIAGDDCIVWIYPHLFIHSAAERPLGSFQPGFLKAAVMNIHAHIFWWTYVYIFQMLSPSYILGISHTFRDVLCYLYVDFFFFSGIGFGITAFMGLKEIRLEVSFPLMSLWRLGVGFP